jgi:hypothetical protein
VRHGGTGGTVNQTLEAAAEVGGRAGPTIFIKNGFRFFFYSNEHRPLHVHVRKGGGEAVFEVGEEIVLRESAGFKTRELQDAEDLATEHRKAIIQAWHEHIG